MTTTARVALEGPLDLDTACEPLRRVGDDLMDRWDGITLRRTVRPGPRSGAAVAYAVTFDGDVMRPVATVVVAAGADLDVALAATVGLTVGNPVALAHLAERDPVIAALATAHPGTVQMRHADLFHALVRAVSAQQVNLRWAATTRARLCEAFGTRHDVAGDHVWSLDPAVLAGCEVTELRALQLTTAKSASIVAVARAIAGGDLVPADLADLSDDEVIGRLVQLRGIGRWTAEWVLARTLGRPVVVAGDLGVRKVVGQAYLAVPIASEQDVRAATAHWGTAATAAQWLLLHAAAAGDDLVAVGKRARAAAS